MPDIKAMPVKLIALDLDGTLFGDDLVIAPRTRKAIADAQAAGIIVTIATGRMFRSARQIADDLNIAGPLICYQGALIQDNTSEEILLHKTVPITLAREVAATCAEMHLHLNVYTDDNLYVSEITPGARFYAQINMDLPMNVVGDLDNWLDRNGQHEPTKLVIITEPEQTDSTLATFTGLFGDRLQVTKSHPRFTELTNRTSSKGRALAILAERYNVPQAQVMAIGDGYNDMDMIEWAGWGVAMATAPQVVRDAARIVSPPLSDDGSADAIERYALSGPLTADD
jgi:Cof subfamily protein (haloacid dehalogenase superfamily)